MIEMVPAHSKIPASPEPHLVEPPRPQAEQQESPVTKAGVTPAQLNERQQRVAPSNAGFEVMLDSDTMRMYAELRDPETERVIVRIPTGYQPAKPQPAGHKPTSLVA